MGLVREKDYFEDHNLIANINGLQLGAEAAGKYKNFEEFTKAICEEEKDCANK